MVQELRPKTIVKVTLPASVTPGQIYAGRLADDTPFRFRAPPNATPSQIVTIEITLDKEPEETAISLHHLTAVDVDEVTRITRATHSFGILGEVATRVPPSDTRIEQKYQRAMERLHYDDAQRDLGRGRPCSAKRRFKAEERLRNAYYMLRNRSIRAQTHAQITRSGPATTRRTRCPIDIKALESYANSPAGNTVFRSQKKHQQVLVGKTVRTVINDFLSHVSSSPNDPDTGFIDIEYTYGKRTSALVATGWITGGREYAKNADPFKLPKFLRNRALCRFGYDFDDNSLLISPRGLPRNPFSCTSRRHSCSKPRGNHGKNWSPHFFNHKN